MDVSERLDNVELIRRLDVEGLDIRDEFRQALEPEAKVRYKSEGLFCELEGMEQFNACIDSFAARCSAIRRLTGEGYMERTRTF
jgi:hypothetical protein